MLLPSISSVSALQVCQTFHRSIKLSWPIVGHRRTLQTLLPWARVLQGWKETPRHYQSNTESQLDRIQQPTPLSHECSAQGYQATQTHFTQVSRPTGGCSICNRLPKEDKSASIRHTPSAKSSISEIYWDTVLMVPMAEVWTIRLSASLCPWKGNIRSLFPSWRRRLTCSSERPSVNAYAHLCHSGIIPLILAGGSWGGECISVICKKCQ